MTMTTKVTKNCTYLQETRERKGAAWSDLPREMLDNIFSAVVTNAMCPIVFGINRAQEKLNRSIFSQIGVQLSCIAYPVRNNTLVYWDDVLDV